MNRSRRGPLRYVALLLLVSPTVVFFSSGILSASGVDEVVESVSLLGIPRVLGRSTLQAALSAAGSVILAVPGAAILGRLEFRGKRFVRALTLVPFVLPSIVVVVAMVGFYGRRGVVTSIAGRSLFDLYGLPGIIVAHVYYNVSIAIRLISEAWSRVSDEHAESAKIAGAGPADYLVRIVAPLLAPSMLAASLIVFMYAFLSFGIVLVFGGLGWPTIEVRIFETMFVSGDRVAAGWLALVQLVWSGAIFLAFSSILPRVQAARSTLESRPKRFRSLAPTVRVAVLVYGGLLVFLAGGPLVAILPRAGLDGFRTLIGTLGVGRSLQSATGSSLIALIIESFGIALAAGGISLSVAIPCARVRRGRLASTAAHLPLAISVVTFSAGLHIMLGDIFPPRLVLVLLQAFLAFPVVYRVVEGAIAELPGELRDAARVAGAGAFSLFTRIELPLLGRSLTSAAAYAVAIPLADFTAVMVVGRGRIVTFPVAIYRMLGFRSFDGALALAVIYIALVLIVFLAIDRRSGAGAGPF